jgi:DNA-binding HxlR family transcriptional regulator
MQRKSFGSMSCPIARSLERVGEWWSILILRDAFRGLTRFDQFQKSLDIAPNMLTRRLNALVERGCSSAGPTTSTRLGTSISSPNVAVIFGQSCGLC